MKDRVYEPHESSWRISETERHDDILVETITSNEGRLWYVLLPYLNLVITLSQIHLGEDGCTTQLIDQIIYPWNRIFVLDGHHIQRTVVYD